MELLKEKGWEIIPQVLEVDFCDKINLSVEKAYLLCRDIQQKNGIDQVTDGTIHHLLAVKDEIFLKALDTIFSESILEKIAQYFGSKFILNSYGAVKNLKSKPSYVANIHRDIRFFTENLPFMLNVLIMLDDFTIERGATYLLSGSHLKPEKPEENRFYENAERAIGKKGDVLLFDSNLWHAAGINKTDEERRAITITLTKPFMKQQLDYCRVIGYGKVENLSEKTQQLLGYFSRTPTNLEEWYQPPHKRFYRPQQD